LLEYKSKTQEDEIKNGKLEIKEAYYYYYYYYIEIPKKIPGKASHLSSKQLLVKFEDGSSGLIFGWDKASNLYYLNGKTKKGSFM